MPKIEFRDVLALLALGVVVFSLWLEACGHPVAEWLRAPIGTIVSVVLGFYFVDSAAKRAVSAAQAPKAGATESSPAPTEGA